MNKPYLKRMAIIKRKSGNKYSTFITHVIRTLFLIYPLVIMIYVTKIPMNSNYDLNFKLAGLIILFFFMFIIITFLVYFKVFGENEFIINLKFNGMINDEICQLYIYEIIPFKKIMGNAIALQLLVSTYLIFIFKVSVMKCIIAFFLSLIVIVLIYVAFYFDLFSIIKKKSTISKVHARKHIISYIDVVKCQLLGSSLIIIGTITCCLAITFIKSFDINGYINVLYKSDYWANGSDSEDTIIDDKYVPDQIIQTIKQSPYYKNGGGYHFNSNENILLYTNLLPEKSRNTGENFIKRKGGYQFYLYGADSYIYKRLKVIEGKVDQKKLNTGHYIIDVTRYNEDTVPYNVPLYNKKYDYFKVGQKISISYSGTKKTYTIIAKCLLNHTVGETEEQNDSNNDLIFYLPCNEYVKHINDHVRRFAFNTTKSIQINNFRKKYSRVFFLSKQEMRKFYEKDFFHFLLVILIIGMFILCIGLLNIMSTIVSGIQNEKNEYTILESVGMLKKEIRFKVVKLNILMGISVCLFLDFLYFVEIYYIRIYMTKLSVCFNFHASCLYIILIDVFILVLIFSLTFGAFNEQVRKPLYLRIKG